VAIRQVYFDLNGTLFDPSAMAEPIGGEEADDLVEEILGEAVLLAMAETLSGSYRDFAELLRAAAFRRLALAGRQERVDDVMSAAKRMQPFPDAGEAVSTLRSAGFGVGVLTNSTTESAESLVARSGLDLERVVGTDQVRAFKPDRRVYERGAAAAGRSVEEVILITAHGWDAIGAKRAGMLAAWISAKEGIRPPIDPTPDLEVETLAEAAERIALVFSV
jgi:2-haloacid dehalogenase